MDTISMVGMGLLIVGLFVAMSLVKINEDEDLCIRCGSDLLDEDDDSLVCNTCKMYENGELGL